MAHPAPAAEPRSASLEQAFRDAEASLLLEGFDPTQDPRYLEIRAEVIAGTLSFDQAEAAIDALYTEPAQADRPIAVPA